MSKPKTHYEVITSEPNESDTQGESYILCGRDSADKLTTSAESVTCANCLRRITFNHTAKTGEQKNEKENPG